MMPWKLSDDVKQFHVEHQKTPPARADEFSLSARAGGAFLSEQMLRSLSDLEVVSVFAASFRGSVRAAGYSSRRGMRGANFSAPAVIDWM